MIDFINKRSIPYLLKLLKIGPSNKNIKLNPPTPPLSFQLLTSRDQFLRSLIKMNEAVTNVINQSEALIR